MGCFILSRTFFVGLVFMSSFQKTETKDDVDIPNNKLGTSSRRFGFGNVTCHENESLLRKQILASDLIFIGRVLWDPNRKKSKSKEVWKERAKPVISMTENKFFNMSTSGQRTSQDIIDASLGRERQIYQKDSNSFIKKTMRKKHKNSRRRNSKDKTKRTKNHNYSSVRNKMTAKRKPQMGRRPLVVGIEKIVFADLKLNTSLSINHVLLYGIKNPKRLCSSFKIGQKRLFLTKQLKSKRKLKNVVVLLRRVTMVKSIKKIKSIIRLVSKGKLSLKWKRSV